MVAMSTGTVDGNAPPGRTADDLTIAPRPRRKRRWLLGSVLVLGAGVLAAAVVAAILGAAYQPVIFGGGSAGLSGQIASRQVDTVGPFGPQTYIPPQPAARGVLIMSLGNTGPLPVTIESVSMLAPGVPPGQRQNLVLSGAGSVTYTSLENMPTARSPRLDGTVLAPGQYIYIRMPVVSARCWVRSSWTAVTSFWVTTRYLLWTHHVQIDWTGAEFPSGAIIAREAIPAGTNTPSLECPGSGSGSGSG
jgi:hypothetical protein